MNEVCGLEIHLAGQYIISACYICLLYLLMLH